MTEGILPQPFEGALGLASLSRWGCSPLLRFLREYGPERVWSAPRGTLLGWGLASAVVRRFEEKRRTFSLDAELRALEIAGLRFVPYGSAAFPAGLTHLSYPPAGLFVRGSEEAMARLGTAPCVAVVGTRKASAYGTRMAEVFTAAFVGRGVAVVSGMAFGIDARAHLAALDAGGLTAAVLGCGADVVYPRRHHRLYQRLTSEGLIMSELPPGCLPARWTFPHRNRLLAALADAVLVVEGSRSSGALQTATWALELGRTVFAVPGPVMVENHEGCNALLYDGASPALDPRTTVEDFLFATGIERRERMDGDGRRSQEGLAGGADILEFGGRPMFDTLALGPFSVDDLAAQSGRSVREITACLALMEMQGMVVRAGPGLFIRAP